MTHQITQFSLIDLNVHEIQVYDSSLLIDSQLAFATENIKQPYYLYFTPVPHQTIPEKFLTCPSSVLISWGPVQTERDPGYVQQQLSTPVTWKNDISHRNLPRSRYEIATSVSRWHDSRPRIACIDAKDS